jgi:Leucine-rich repeat (LRR) protein
MSITILNKEYDIKLQKLNLEYNKLSSLPAEICKLIKLQMEELTMIK